jgi:hypothetical protein
MLRENSVVLLSVCIVGPGVSIKMIEIKIFLNFLDFVNNYIRVSKVESSQLEI